MITTLLSLLGGGLMRALPEILSLLNKKADNDHEYRMLQGQIQLEAQRSQGQQAEIQIKGAIDEAVASIQATADALKGQMQPQGLSFQLVGSKLIDGANAIVRLFIDAMNMLVRPVVTYYFLGLFGLYKAALLQVALSQTNNVWTAILQVYTADDAAILSGVLAFWFVGRVFDKKS